MKNLAIYSLNSCIFLVLSINTHYQHPSNSPNPAKKNSHTTNHSPHFLHSKSQLNSAFYLSKFTVSFLFLLFLKICLLNRPMIRGLRGKRKSGMGRSTGGPRYSRLAVLRIRRLTMPRISSSSPNKIFPLTLEPSNSLSNNS